MAEYDSSGLPILSDNAARYKQLHDDSVKGYMSTMLGGFGARLGWKYGRPLLGKTMQLARSKDNNSNSWFNQFRNNIATGGDYLLDNSDNRSLQQRVVQHGIDLGFGGLGLAGGHYVGKNVASPIYLSLAEGAGTGTSKKNIQATYDRLFGQLSPKQQETILNQIERRNESVYGTTKRHGGIQKALNIIGTTAGGIAGDYAADSLIANTGLKDSNTLTGRLARGTLKTIGNVGGSLFGSNATTGAYNVFHGDQLSAIPNDYYQPDETNTGILPSAGRGINSTLNAILPGREFAHPDMVALKPGEKVRDKVKEHIKQVNRNKAKYNNNWVVRKFVHPAEKALGRVFSPLDTLTGDDTDFNPFNNF